MPSSDHSPDDPALAALRSLPKEMRNLVAGGLAGMLAKSFVAPIDRIKILYQVTSARFRLRDVPGVARSIIEKEGWAALWKGNTATMVRVFPYSGIQFMVFDYCKVHYLGEKRRRDRYASDGKDGGGGSTGTANNTANLDHRRTAAIPTNAPVIPSGDRKAGLTPIESLVSGMIAGTVSVLCTYPLDLARAQLAVLRKTKEPANLANASKLDGQLGIGSTAGRSRKGIRYVLSGSFQQSGARGLYRGITPTILGILPYSGLAFAINEQSKRQVAHIAGRDPTTIERLQCGALSGLFAQTLAYPLEVTRRRMQTVGIVPAPGSGPAAASVAGVPRPRPSADGVPRTARRRQIQTRAAGHAPSAAAGNGEIVGQSIAGSAAAPQHPQQAPRQCSSTPPTMMATMRNLFEEQGVRGFYKGVSMNWVKGPIAFSISFTAFDTIQQWIETDAERAEKSGQFDKMAITRRLTNNED